MPCILLDVFEYICVSRAHNLQSLNFGGPDLLGLVPRPPRLWPSSQTEGFLSKSPTFFSGEDPIQERVSVSVTENRIMVFFFCSQANTMAFTAAKAARASSRGPSGKSWRTPAEKAGTASLTKDRETGKRALNLRLALAPVARWSLLLPAVGFHVTVICCYQLHLIVIKMYLIIYTDNFL